MGSEDPVVAQEVVDRRWNNAVQERKDGAGQLGGGSAAVAAALTAAAVAGKLTLRRARDRAVTGASLRSGAQRSSRKGPSIASAGQLAHAHAHALALALQIPKAELRIGNKLPE